MKKLKFNRLLYLILIFLLSGSAFADLNSQTRPRARQMGLIIGDFKPGPLNAITDVAGVKVGHVTKNFGSGKNAVRTGVTAILPHGGDLWREKVPSGGFVYNGCGELTGLHWVNEAGCLEVPILLTNTHCVGKVSDALIGYWQEKYPEIGLSDDVLTPVVGECDDSYLNDIRARAVEYADLVKAIETASGGEVAEGNAGAGTGMICYGFKGGIGTSSRLLPKENGGYTVGVLLLCNFGNWGDLLIDGLPVGKELAVFEPCLRKTDGSVIGIIATDAPLDSRQLIRLSKRAMLGMAGTGSTGDHGSGDFFLAFSTAQRLPHYPKELTFSRLHFADTQLDALFKAVAEATQEAVLNALFKAETMTGREGNTVYALPLEPVKKILKYYRRLN